MTSFAPTSKCNDLLMQIAAGNATGITTADLSNQQLTSFPMEVIPLLYIFCNPFLLVIISMVLVIDPERLLGNFEFRK